MKRLFAGRMNRSTYLLVNLTTALFAILLSRPDVERYLNSHDGVTLIVVFVVALPLLVWQFAAAARRLHGRNVNGWFSFLILLPMAQLVLLLLPGTKGPNNFGPQPTEPFDLQSIFIDTNPGKP